jgi:hypothetical protein
MTFTYTNPSASDLGATRFLIGDTDANYPQLTDEEINYLLTAKGSVYAAAIAACDALIGKYSRDVDVRFGPSSESNSQRKDAYKLLKTQLKSAAISNGVALPFSGGISIADKQTQEGDSDRVLPNFTKNQFDYPGDASELGD